MEVKVIDLDNSHSYTPKNASCFKDYQKAFDACTADGNNVEKPTKGLEHSKLGSFNLASCFDNLKEKFLPKSKTDIEKIIEIVLDFFDGFMDYFSSRFTQENLMFWLKLKRSFKEPIFIASGLGIVFALLVAYIFFDWYTTKDKIETSIDKNVNEKTEDEIIKESLEKVGKLIAEKKKNKKSRKAGSKPTYMEDETAEEYAEKVADYERLFDEEIQNDMQHTGYADDFEELHYVGAAGQRVRERVADRMKFRKHGGDEDLDFWMTEIEHAWKEKERVKLDAIPKVITRDKIEKKIFREEN